MGQPTRTPSPSVPPHRRRRSNTPVVRKSLSLHEDVLQAAEAAVGAGEAVNLSAYVEEAIQERLRRSKRTRLYAAYAEASQDPAFMADMRDVTAEFDAAAGDGLRDA